MATTPRSVGQAVVRRIGPVASQSSQAAGGVLRRVLEIAIDGYGKVPSARAVAAKQLQKHEGSVGDAIDGLIDSHVRLGSAQGFLTNLGGLATLPVAIPANLTGIAVVQTRMVAAVAHLRGYDLNDNRVRTAVVMCLMGGEAIARRIHHGKLPTSPMAIATAPIFDADLDAKIAEEVVADLLGRVGGRRLALVVTKRIPLLGGGVSAAVDGVATYQIGQYAKGELVAQRALAR